MVSEHAALLMCPLGEGGVARAAGLGGGCAAECEGVEAAVAAGVRFLSESAWLFGGDGCDDAHAAEDVAKFRIGCEK